MSPRLFNVYGEFVIRRALDRYSESVSTGCRMLTNLLHADNTSRYLIGKERPELQKITAECIALVLEINLRKTKLIIVDRGNNLQLEDLPLGIEVDNEYIYLGSLVSSRGNFRRRIAMAPNAVVDPTKIGQSDNQKYKEEAYENSGVPHISVWSGILDVDGSGYKADGRLGDVA